MVAAVIVFTVAVAAIEPYLPVIILILSLVILVVIGWKVLSHIRKRRQFF